MMEYSVFLRQYSKQVLNDSDKEQNPSPEKDHRCSVEYLWLFPMNTLEMVPINS